VNAYEVLATSSKDGQMNDQVFSDLVHDFRNGWLSKENHAERLELHRQPLVLKNEILRKLYDYFQDIQRRPEMRCPDLEGKGSSYVPTVVTEIINRDKRIQSTFDAIVVYCQWSKSDLLTMAVHMAECKAVEELIALFQRETMEHNEQQRTNSFFRFAEEHEALKRKFMIEAPITQEEAAQDPRLTEGQLMRRNPEIPNDPQKAFELFRNYYARVQFLFQKDCFYNKYGIWNEPSVTAEIQAIEAWIAEAGKLSYSEVCERKDFTNEQHEFLRLENGYYEGYVMSWDQCNENSTAARVYGRYFHFLTYLKSLQFDLIAARSNYRDAEGQLIPARLVRPEVQRRIEMETRARIRTLPLEDQYYYYRAILNTNITRKRDYLASGETDKDRIAIFDVEMEYATMEIGRIERAISMEQAASQKGDNFTGQSNLYRNLAHKLFIGKTEINGTHFTDKFEFIEQVHAKAPYRGEVFYSNLLHALPDHFGAKMFPKLFKELADYCGAKIAEHSGAKIAGKPPTVTVPDKILRELNLIQAIYTAQYSVFDPTNNFPYPMILDEQGKSGIDGRIISGMDLYATSDLFQLQQYKQHFTGRFEQTTNLDLVTSQLKEIYMKAEAVLDYYNHNLTDKARLVNRHIQRRPKEFAAAAEYTRRHSAVVVISGEMISEIYLGLDRSSISGRLGESSRYPFTSFATNRDLAEYCQKIMAFVEQFQIRGTRSRKTGAKTRPQPIDKLSVVFEDQAYFQQAIQALQDIKVIDEEKRNKIGAKLKGVMQVWVAILRSKGKIKHISEKDLTLLLNKEFPGLNLGERTDGRSLRGRNKSAEAKYKVKLEQRL
jgi:hypothetical protein